MKNNYSSRIKGITFVLCFLSLFLWVQPSFADLGFTPETSLDRGTPIPTGYPTASTTGVVGAGVPYSSLTPYSGTFNIDGQHNTVIEGKDITGYVHILNSSNVTLKNCRITCTGYLFGIRIEASNSMITIENCEIVATSEGTSTCIGTLGGGIDSLIVRNCDISGGADGMKVTSNNLIEGNYIHHLSRWYNPAQDDWTHNDCLQTLTAFNVIISGNTLLGPYHYANSTFQCQTDAGSISNITHENNYLSGGGNSLNIREKNGYTVTNMIIRNNLWEDDTFLYGPYYRTTAEVPVSYGNRFTSGGECDIVTGKCVPNDNQTAYTATINNFSRDRTMFDSDMARGNNSAEVGLSGTSNAPNGYSIEARAVSTEDGGATTTNWRAIATVSNGSWSGVLGTPRSSSWYKAEVRVAGSSSTAITSNRFGVGLIIFHSGQSNYERVANIDGSATPITIGDNGDNFQMYNIENRGTISGSDANSTIGGPYFITDATPRTDAMRAMAALYHKNAPGLKVMVLFDIKPGLQQELTLKDSDTRRMWESIQKLFGKGAWAGTGPMADGQQMGIFIQGHVNDISDELMAEWYAATCLGKLLDGSDIAGVSHTGGFPTADVFANVGGSWQHLYINHLWTEAMPGLRTGRTQVQLKEPGATYATTVYPTGYDLRRQARETLVQTYPDHFHWANDYPFLKRYYPNATQNANHFDVNNIYGSPLKGQSLAVSVLRQIGAIPFDIPHFDIITKTSTYIELGSSAGPVTTMARAQGDNTNFTTDVDPVGSAGLAEVQGFQYANFKQPTRVEIVDNNGNRASAGKIRVYLDNGYTDLYYAMGASGCTGSLFDFNEALFMRHLPIVDVGIEGGLMEHGVWVEPYTDREFINDGIPTNIPVTSVALSANQLDMTVGQTIKLNAIISPTNASNKNVDWSSANTSIATVDQYGNVTANATGSTTITVTTDDGDHTDVCSVSVTTSSSSQSAYAINALPGRIQFEDFDNGGEGVAYHDDATKSLDASIRPSEFVDIETTSDVDGVYNLGWVANGEWLEFTLTDVAAGIYSIDVRAASNNATPGNLVVKLGDGPDGSNFATIATVPVSNTGGWENWQTFSVSNISLSQGANKVLRVEIDGSGFDMNWIDFSAVKVPTSITLNQVTADLLIGGTLQLNETVLPVDAADKTVTWSSSNSSVATVNASGLVTAQTVGAATITVTTNTGGYTANCIVNIAPSQSAYTVNSLPGRIQIEDYDNGGEGVAFHDVDEKKLDLTIRPDDNVDLETTSDVDGVYNMGWSSNGEWLEYTLADVAAGIYTIDVRAASGIASPGDILVKLGDGPDGVNFVTIATVPISGTGGWENWQTFTVNNISIDAGTNKVLRLQFDEAGYDLNWINFSALILPTSITLNPTSDNLHIGETVQINETVLPADAADKTVTWSSSNASVATVDANGLVSALSLGTATITATTNVGGLTASCTVNVTPISVTGVTLDISSLTLNIGGSSDLDETVAPADATDKSVTWSSNNTAVATVNSSGVVSAISDGNAVITVTTNDGGFTAQCNVTVNSGGATPTNVALNKTVTASAENLPGDPVTELVDGDPIDGNRWSAPGFPQWAEVDLGDTYQLSSIEVVTYQGRDYQYIIEASLDGSSYTQIVDKSSSCQGTNLVDVVDIIARYVKITVSGACTYTGTWVSINELLVFGVPAEVPDPAIIDEDFASGASDFTVIAGGTWAVSGGRYVLSSPAAGATGFLGNTSIHNTVVNGDFELSTLLNITGTTSTWDDAAVVFNYQDINNYYYVSLNETNDQNTKGIFKVENGAYTQIADITTSISSNTDYILEISRTGNDIVVSLDGAQIASAIDATFSSGKVGYGSKNDGAQFDDLLVIAGSAAKSLQQKASISNSLSEMVVYPNPNPGDNVFIELPAKFEDVNVSVYDISGKKIIQQSINGEQHININLSNKSTLKKGVYIIEVIAPMSREMSKLIVR